MFVWYDLSDAHSSAHLTVLRSVMIPITPEPKIKSNAARIFLGTSFFETSANILTFLEVLWIFSILSITPDFTGYF